MLKAFDKKNTSFLICKCLQFVAEEEVGSRFLTTLGGWPASILKKISDNQNSIWLEVTRTTYIRSPFFLLGTYTESSTAWCFKVKGNDSFMGWTQGPTPICLMMSLMDLVQLA